MTRLEQLQARLSRVLAFQRVFVKDGALTDDAREVFTTLRDFCEINKAGLLPRMEEHVYRDGKRAVWEKVNGILNEDVTGLQNEIARIINDE